MRIEKAPIDEAVNVKGFASFPLYEGSTQANDGIKMGYAVFGPGARVPKEGTASHPEDEFAYIISGGLKCCSGGVVYESKAGCSSFIPAGEEHFSINESDEPCTLIYMLADKK